MSARQATRSPSSTRSIPTRLFREADKFGTRTAANWKPKACLVVKTRNSTYALNVEGELVHETFIIHLTFGGVVGPQESLNRHVDKPVKVSRGLEQSIYDAMAFQPGIPDFSRVVAGKKMTFTVKGLCSTVTSTVTECSLVYGHATNFSAEK